MTTSPRELAERSLTPPRLDRVDRETLADYFVNTWELYEWLFSSIRDDESLYLNPDPLRQPLIFYLGHPAVFYVNKLKLAGVIDEGLNEHFERLFAVGVDPAKAAELEAEAWPSVDDVRAYRSRVFDFMLDRIGKLDIELPVGPDDTTWAVLMGLEHDRIHFETSSVLIRQYETGRVRRPDGWEYAPAGGAAPTPELVGIPGGELTLGKPDDARTFGWDSDYGSRDVAVADFRAGRHPVTNAEFLEFVRDGGYGRRDLWTEEGWAWKSAAGAGHPKFWVPRGDDFAYRAMFDELDLPAAWPVEVNALEAEAFCRWMGDGSRLPSEAEFAAMARGAPQVDHDCLFADVYNLNLAFGSPSPVGHFPEGRTEQGLDDLFGNVWEWLSDDFRGLPGFEAHELYLDFSEPFMDPDHNMLAGCSWASSGVGASRWYRLWFRRNFFQHAGFRVAKDA